MKKTLLHCLAILTVVTILIGYGIFFLFFYYDRDLPDYEFLKHYQPPVITSIYSNDGQILREYGKERRIFAPIETISPLLIEAFLAAEDKNFYHHPGLDLRSMARAAISNSINGTWGKKPLGASTITQQVAKNFLIGNERSFIRKIKEAIMAIRLEHVLSKHRILELYLNGIYLGAGSYGVTAAALTYFNKPLDKLTIAECAYLASLPKAPTTYHPEKDPKRAKNRRDWTIDRLVEERTITKKQAKRIKQEPIILQPPPPIPHYADYFVEEVRREISANFGESSLHYHGLVVKTTLDRNLQNIAEKSLQTGLREYDRRHGWRGAIAYIHINETEGNAWVKQLQNINPPPGIGNWKLAIVVDISSTQSAKIGFTDGTTGEIPLKNLSWARHWKKGEILGKKVTQVQDVLEKGDVIVVSSMEDQSFMLEQIPSVTGSIVVIDPGTGHVLALSGGYSFEINQFNCATQAQRQPGSAFKPFVYMAALERGYTAETSILDAPLSASLGDGLGAYTPRNYSGNFHGLIPLRSGLELSRNVMTVRLAQDIGMQSIKEMAKRFDIVNDLPMELTMALGAAETSLLRLTNAYAMIANGGKRIRTSFVESIQDQKGRTIYFNTPRFYQTTNLQGHTIIIDDRETIADPRVIEEMIKMLEGVVQNGTAKQLIPLTQTYTTSLAGKTGTTNGYKDAWFVGFTRSPNRRNLAVGIFVGFSSPKSLGEGESGSKVAVPIFESFIQKALTGLNS